MKNLIIGRPQNNVFIPIENFEEQTNETRKLNSEIWISQYKEQLKKEKEQFKH